MPESGRVAVQRSFDLEAATCPGAVRGRLEGLVNIFLIGLSQMRCAEEKMALLSLLNRTDIGLAVECVAFSSSAFAQNATTAGALTVPYPTEKVR